MRPRPKAFNLPPDALPFVYTVIFHSTNRVRMATVQISNTLSAAHRQQCVNIQYIISCTSTAGIHGKYLFFVKRASGRARHGHRTMTLGEEAEDTRHIIPWLRTYDTSSYGWGHTTPHPMVEDTRHIIPWLRTHDTSSNNRWHTIHHPMAEDTRHIIPWLMTHDTSSHGWGHTTHHPMAEDTRHITPWLRTHDCWWGLVSTNQERTQQKWALRTRTVYKKTRTHTLCICHIWAVSVQHAARRI